MAKSTLRKFSSLFFLGIFLWFNAVKDFHEILHADDPHCFVKNVKHFHAKEHHCPICEFEFPGFDTQTPNVEVSSINFVIKVQNNLTVRVISSEPVSFSSPRAPPVVA